jgi:hypothetical protein
LTLTNRQFKDEYLKLGEAGGRQAASHLNALVKNWIDVDAKDIPTDSRIVCRVYANVRGLGDVLARKGIVEDVGVFEDFTRGFTRGKVYFDFVDVGSGKDRADEKLIGKSKCLQPQTHMSCACKPNLRSHFSADKLP